MVRTRLYVNGTGVRTLIEGGFSDVSQSVHPIRGTPSICLQSEHRQ